MIKNNMINLSKCIRSVGILLLLLLLAFARVEAQTVRLPDIEATHKSEMKQIKKRVYNAKSVEIHRFPDGQWYYLAILKDGNYEAYKDDMTPMFTPRGGNYPHTFSSLEIVTLPDGNKYYKTTKYSLYFNIYDFETGVSLFSGGFKDLLSIIVKTGNDGKDYWVGKSSSAGSNNSFIVQEINNPDNFIELPCLNENVIDIDPFISPEGFFMVIAKDKFGSIKHIATKIGSVNDSFYAYNESNLYLNIGREEGWSRLGDDDYVKVWHSAFNSFINRVDKDSKNGRGSIHLIKGNGNCSYSEAPIPGTNWIVGLHNSDKKWSIEKNIAFINSDSIVRRRLIMPEVYKLYDINDGRVLLDSIWSSNSYLMYSEADNAFFYSMRNDDRSMRLGSYFLSDTTLNLPPLFNDIYYASRADGGHDIYIKRNTLSKWELYDSNVNYSPTYTDDIERTFETRDYSTTISLLSYNKDGTPDYCTINALAAYNLTNDKVYHVNQYLLSEYENASLGSEISDYFLEINKEYYEGFKFYEELRTAVKNNEIFLDSPNPEIRLLAQQYKGTLEDCLNLLKKYADDIIPTARKNYEDRIVQEKKLKAEQDARLETQRQQLEEQKRKKRAEMSTAIFMGLGRLLLNSGASLNTGYNGSVSSGNSTSGSSSIMRSSSGSSASSSSSGGLNNAEKRRLEQIKSQIRDYENKLAEAEVNQVREPSTSRATLIRNIKSNIAKLEQEKAELESRM